MIKVYNETLYLVKQTNGKYKVVNGNLTAKGTTLYSLEKTTLDSNMKPSGSWYYTPQFITADDIEAYQATVEAIADMVPMAASSTALIVDGHTVDITFNGTVLTVGPLNDISFASPNLINRVSGSFLNDGFVVGGTIEVNTTSNTNDGTYTITSVTGTQIAVSQTSITTETAMTAGVTTLIQDKRTPFFTAIAINAAAETQIGTAYNNIAQVVGDRIKLVAPNAANSFFVIPPNSVWQSYLFIPSGEYGGDLPYPDRSYAENEYYILYQESVTPNNGTASGKFYPTVADNNMLRYTTEFDRNLIEANPRTKLLFDSFAFVMGRLDNEMTRFIDQLDISKIDTDQLEAMAYLFGIPIDSLIRVDGTVSAREMLKTIMRVIQDKGSAASFELLLRIAGFNTSVREFYADDSEVDKTVTTAILEAFVERFLNKQSLFRNPVLSYGSSVSDLSLLPTVGYQDEIITVLPPSVDKGIYKYDIVNGWELVTTETNPQYGQGIDVDQTIADLGFRFKFIEEPWKSISVDEWNNTRVLNGFDIRPSFSTTISGTLREITTIPLRAELISLQAAPWDLTLTQNKILNLLVNNSIAYNIDFSAFETQIADFSAVTFDEIKYIIENNFSELVAINDSGRLMLRSKRVGQGSSIKCYNNNVALGYTLSQAHNIGYFVDQFQVDIGQANPSETIAQMPQVTSAVTMFKLQSEDLNRPLDGLYTLWVDSVGDIVISSDKLFYGTLYSPGLGWVTKDVSVNSIAKIGTVQIINGQVAYITDVTHRDDVVLSDNFTEEQSKAIQAFIRSKVNVAHRTGSVTISEGAPYPFPQPFYFRDGAENTLNTAEKGYSNEIVLDSTAIKSDFILTYDIIKQLDTFIRYVRPVHISALTILLNVPYLFDSWVRAYDRTDAGDYIPGFWDGRQSVEPLIDSGVVTVANQYTIAYDGFYSDKGVLTTNTAYTTVYLNGAIATGYTITGNTITFTSAPIGSSVTVEFYYKDGKNGNQTKTQLDIMERLKAAYGLTDGLFTDGDAYASTPTSGENEITEWNDHAMAQRNNNFTQATANGSVSNYLGTTEYETEWLGGLASWVATKQLGQAKFAVTTTRHQDVTVDTTSIIRLDTENILANDIAIGETVTFYNAAGSYIYTAVAGVPVGRQFQVGTDPATSLSNLASSINANDSLLMTATYSNYVLTVVSAANNYITVDSTINSSKFAIYNEYYAPKKPMITSFVNGLILSEAVESAKTAVVPTYITDHNTSLPYYNYSHYMHRGHTNRDMTVAQIGTETSFLSDFYYRGLDNTNFTYNWESISTIYNIADIRIGTPYYHGSENYDGGPKTTGVSGGINDIDVSQYYVESVDPVAGHYRSQGMHNAEPVSSVLLTGFTNSDSKIINVVVKAGIVTGQGVSLPTAINSLFIQNTPVVAQEMISALANSVTSDNKTSVTCDSLGFVHVVYYNDPLASLYYSTNASGSWVHTSISGSSSKIGSVKSIAIDSLDKVHIAFWFNSTDLYYATNASGSWVLTPVDTVGTVGGAASIAIDSLDKIHISYYDQTSFDLKYATNAGGGWVSEIVDASGTVGSFTSIGIDSSDLVHICYYKDTGGDLKYAFGSYGSWTTSTIDSTGISVGQFESMIVDNYDKIHVCYRDFFNNDLKYASNKSGVWVDSVIDNNAWQRGGTDIVLGRDVVYIVYTVNDSTLKIAVVDVTTDMKPLAIFEHTLNPVSDAGFLVDASLSGFLKPDGNLILTYRGYNTLHYEIILLTVSQLNGDKLKLLIT